MATPAAVLQILVTANTAQAVTGLQAVDAQGKRTAASTSASTSRMSRGFSALGSVAKTALVGGVAYGLYSGVKAGIDFEKQMDAVGAVADASRKEMKKLENQALRLGQKTAYSATEAAQAQEELAKGGLKTSDILGGALKASLSLAAAGQLDLSTAAETTVNAMKLFELRARDAGKVADMFATAANKTTADVEDFAMALKQGGSAAKAAGYNINQTMVVLEALAEAGIKNSDAGTSMKAAFLQLLAPTEKQAALAKQLNIDWVNQNGNLKSAVGISKELQDALGGMTNAQQAANLKVLAGTDGFRTLNALMDEGPAKLRELAKANREQGTAQEVANKKMDNTAGSIEQLQGAWETLSISLFQKAQSPFRSVIDSMTGAIKDLTDVVTDKSLTSDEKISKVMEMITSAIADAVPKVLGVGVQIGTALMRGIANAFIHGSILTKLFIGAGAIRLFGGAGVFGRIGGTIASKIMGGLAGKLGGLGGTIAGGLTTRGTSPLNPVFVKDVGGGGTGGGPVGGGRGGGVRPFLPGISAGAIALTAGAFRKQIIDALFPEGWANDALHNAFDSSSITTSGGTGGFFGDDIVEQVTKTWDGIFGGGKIMGQFTELRGAMQKMSVVAQQMGLGLKITRSQFKFAGQGASFFGNSLLDGIDSVKRWAQAVKRNNEDVGGSLSRVGRAFKGLAGDTDKNLGRSRDDIQKFEDTVNRVQGKVGKDLKEMGEDVIDFAGKADKGTDKAGDSFDKFSAKSKRMAEKVGGNITNLAKVVTSGLGIIVNNTNKALKGFGVKKVAISLTQVGDAAKGFQTGGVIVPGQGDGDKVPALLEPGEVVLNKRAVAAMGGADRANAINRMIPRFARGGTVGGVTGGLHPAILQLVTQLYNRFGGSVTSGVRGGDTGSLHSTGQAADYVPSNWPGAAAAANRFGSSLLEGIYNPAVHGGPAVSWDSGARVPTSFWGGSTWAGHMDHIHLAVADGTKAVMGSAFESIKRVLLKGPDGPLKDMGQAALDKVRDAANDYLRSKMPAIGAGKPGAPVKGLPEALQKYNRLYAEHNSAEGDWGGYRMPFNAVAALAEWAGAPGVSMARTAIGESNLRPGATGVDPGGSKGWGLHMITTGVGNDSMINSYGGGPAMLNPVTNSRAMNEIFQSAGYGAWYSSTKDTSNTHYHGPLLRQAGGIVQKLAKGGKPDEGKGTFTPGPAVVVERARKMWEKIMELGGEDAQSGKVALMLERIQIAEDLANADDFLSGAELERQIALHKKLLRTYKKLDKMAKRGGEFTADKLSKTKDKATRRQLKGLRRRFEGVEQATSGLTGKGGLILAEQLLLNSLKGTSTTDDTAKIEDLRTLLSQSQQRFIISQQQYGIFAGTPIQGAFAKGGMASRSGSYLVGERGPEVVHLSTGDKVSPNSALSPSVNVAVTLYEDRDRALVDVNGKEFVAAVKRVNRRQARSGGRTLPGRAGS